MKRVISYLLAAVMLASVLACGSGMAFADEAATVTIEASDVDLQLSLIYTQLDKLKVESDENTWYYSVTDLDHDGNLEFVAAALHPQDRSTNLKVWEISEDRQTLTECRLEKDEDESFPDIMTDVADTYHDAETDTWFYMVYDNLVISDNEVYTVKTAVNLKDGVIDYDAYAVQHIVIENNVTTVSHTDANGIAISAEQYNAAGSNAFAGTERTSTNFAWLTAQDLESFTRVVESYAVFSGAKEPTEVFPVPRPAALQGAAATPNPTATPVPTTKPVEEVKYLAITKNPTNENRKVGNTALFVACANAFESLSWTLVSPNGGEYSVSNFRSYFGANVTGEYSTTLSIANVTTDMNGWGAYCSFYYKGQTQRTATAYLYVQGAPTPAPTSAPSEPESGVLYGSVAEWSYSSITINLDAGLTATVPWEISSVSGDIYTGAPATVVWRRTANGVDYDYTSCTIEGRQPEPQPIYGSMSGTAYEGGGGFAINLADGSQVYVDSWICSVSGTFYDGAACTVYYTYIPDADNIYQVDIYGSTYVEPESYDVPDNQPYFGSISGRAFDNLDGRVAVYLDNGDTLYVDTEICNFFGELVAAGGGNPCVANYIDEPTLAGIYGIDIYAAEES